MTKSKITQVAPQADKNWDGKVLKKDFVFLENGESGTITTFPDNTQPVVGDEIEYTAEDKGFGNELKIARAGGGGGGFKAKQWTPQQVAQQDAVKLTAAALSSGNLPLADYRTFFSEAKAFLTAQIEADNLPI